MYRVAAIGQYIADHLQPDVKVDKDLITKVNLLHDAGNLTKYDFRPGKLLDIDTADIPYWQQVQKEFVHTYGADEHQATETIAKEMGVSGEALELLHQTGIAKIEYAVNIENWNAKIVRMSDERISPHGVVSIEDRYRDIFARYEGRVHELANKQELLKRKQLVLTLANQIQDKCTIDLQKISNADIELYIERMGEYEI
jgi:HD superfamily phosphodiesterase